MANTKTSTARQRLFKLIVVNVAVTLMMVELVALGAYYARTGALYYAHSPQRQPLPETLESAVEAYRLHPYLGFVLKPGDRAPDDQDDVRTVNNYGFESTEDYPYRRRHPRQFVVGLFGGSAAAKLARFEARERVLGDHFADVIECEPERISVLNFAQGGFKQPQQLLVYTYFRSLGQEFDLIINFDGFNDVALAGRNAAAGVAIDMPSIEHLRALQDLTTRTDSYEGLKHIRMIRHSWSEFVRWHNRAWLRQGWETTVAAGFVIDWILGNYHERHYHRARRSYTTAYTSGAAESWLYLNPGDQSINELETMKRAVELWSRSSALMHRAASGDDTPYLHVVQPNQYHPTARVYSDTERRTAFTTESPYPPLVELGYPLLELEVPRLQEQGVAAHELFRIFDHVPHAVYSDDCCHYTDDGQRILLDRIAELAGLLLSEG